MVKSVALKVNDLDNVATIFADVQVGQEVEIRDKKGDIYAIKALSDIAYGHKIATKPIQKSEKIYKYGEEIGVATSSIHLGGYVHVHNLDSARARGDLK